MHNTKTYLSDTMDSSTVLLLLLLVLVVILKVHTTQSVCLCIHVDVYTHTHTHTHTEECIHIHGVHTVKYYMNTLCTLFILQTETCT